MNIDSLTLFVEMYRKGSIARAAEACFMTPQGANRALRGFEAELGCDLFVRTSAGLKPTENGDRFYAFAASTSRSWAELKEVVRLSGLSDANWLHLGFEPDLLSVMLPVLEAFRRSYPSIELRYSDMSEQGLIDGLRTGALDFGFAVLPVAEKDMETVFLGSEQLYVLMGEDHPAAGSSSLPFTHFDGEPLVLVDRGFKARRAFDALCEQTSIVPLMSVSSNDKSFTYDLVRRGQASTIVAEHERARLEMPGIVAVPLEGGRWDYGICFSRDRGISAVPGEAPTTNLERFLAFVEAERP